MLYHHNIPVLASESVVHRAEGVEVKIGPPTVVASGEDSSIQGTLIAPKLRCIGKSIYLNWSFDWDVCDPVQPSVPNGLVSHDAGSSWQHQDVLMPSPTAMYETSENEMTAWSRHAFEVPGTTGVYKVPKWISRDAGRSWAPQVWTTVEYPGTQGVDIYDPPREYRSSDPNYLRGGVRLAPPAYLEPCFKKVSRRRPLLNCGLDPQAEDPEGKIYSMVYGRHPAWRETAEQTGDYWKRIDWARYAVFLQTSEDRGLTWQFSGVPVNGSEYRPRVILHRGEEENTTPVIELCREDDSRPGPVDFAPGDGFSEPSLVIFPDGEMLCALRTGGHKPLYGIRSFDCGRTWTSAQLLSPLYVHPICGVLPRLVLLKNGILALATGRPDCTVHFSKDRGRTWFLSETLFSVASVGLGEIYSGSHCNNAMIAVADDTLLYVHDATRPDPSAPDAWLRKAGHPILIARRIRVDV